jgi:hypothetical protein
VLSFVALSHVHVHDNNKPAWLCRVCWLGASIELEQSINPLFDRLFILTIFPFPVRTFPSPSLTWFNRPFAVDRPSRDDGRDTFVPKAFVHVRVA